MAATGFRRPGSYATHAGSAGATYTLFNTGIYPGAYPQGGVGTRTPLRDVNPSIRLQRTIRQIVRKEAPDIVNLQSLFGFPFATAKLIQEAGVPVILTAHDYFAVCPTAHLFLPEQRPCRLIGDELRCHETCSESPSYWQFWLTSSFDRIAEQLRHSSWLRRLIWRVRNSSRAVMRSFQKPLNSAHYQVRQERGIRFLRSLDALHCISNRQAAVFQELCGPLPNICVLPLMPPTIAHIEAIPRQPEDDRRLCFVALNVGAPYKGAHLLERVFLRLRAEAENYELHVYGNYVPGPAITSVFYHGRYRASDLDRIAASADFCIVPSVCDETLGFVGLEMLARGVPLIASSRAGVSEFIRTGENGYIFNPDDPKNLQLLLARLVQTVDARMLRNRPITNSGLKPFHEHIADVEKLFESATAQAPTAL